MSPRNTPDAPEPAKARDRGLRRVRTTTGLITAASAAGAVVLAGGYAQAMPGKSSSAPKGAHPAAAVAPLAHAVPSSPRATAATTAASSPAVHTTAPAAPPTSTRAQAPAPATSSAPAPAPTTQAPAPQPSTQAPSLQAPAQPPTTAPSTTQTQATSGGS